MRPARPRVLIVDDQAPNIDVLAEALGEGYELFAATSADRAIELAASGMDLILLDVVMPEQNGFDLCRALKAREKTRAIPVIFVTALGEVEDEARGFEAGGVDYITKPISPPTVRARVRTHLELRGAHKRLEKEAEVLAENLRLKEHVERLSRHDLKTPLTSVISIPQILLETPGLTHEQTAMLRSVEAAGYRILDMV
ncbi:MAG: response regulator, partial [Vicinamibacteria bacterium]|nr:response regulator [Vicinamibacteria bacterium]